MLGAAGGVGELGDGAARSELVVVEEVDIEVEVVLDVVVAPEIWEVFGTLEEEQDMLLQHLPLAEHPHKIVVAVKQEYRGWKLEECWVGLGWDHQVAGLVLEMGNCPASDWEKIG